MTTYQVKATCTNCGHEQTLDFPKGVETSIQERYECDYCGCETLKAGSRVQKPFSKHGDDHNKFYCAKKTP